MAANCEKIFKAVDFFCGGGGMTNGLVQAGIQVVAGVDLDLDAKETYEYNNPGAKFINKDITKLQLDFFEKFFGLHPNDDHMVFVGCSPCQFYSIIRSTKEKSRCTKDLLLHFLRFIKYYMPGYVLVENVPGILNNKESIFTVFLQELEKLGYGDCKNGKCVFGIVNMKNYGIPQNRKRFSLIATRLKRRVHLPKQESNFVTVRKAIGNIKKFPKIEAGYRDQNKKRFHSTRTLSELNLRRVQKVGHNGGTRMDFRDDSTLQLKCYIGKDDSFRDVYGRMYWDRPAPTITTKFLSISNGRFGHPEQNRGISVREGAALQSFPMNYEFKTDSITIASRLIGNAVPPEYAKRLGRIILEEK